MIPLSDIDISLDSLWNFMESDINELITEYTRKYRTFIESYSFSPEIIRCLFVNAYNHFLAGRILAESGLITQMNNCLRMGLESEWLGIILVKNEKLGLNWAFGLGDKKEREELKKLEMPAEIRKKIGETPRISIENRNEIYKGLSDKSHTKLSSVAKFFILPGSSAGEGSIECIPLGGIRGENNITRIRFTVKTVLRFALADIEECLGYSTLEEGWSWNRAELVHITEGGYTDKEGQFHPHISSRGHPGQDPYQAAAYLSAMRHGRI